MIASPPETGTSNDLADWLELEVLCSPSGVAPFGAINQDLEIGEDQEPEELDHENLEAEGRIESALAAIEERKDVVRGSYPFQVDAAGSVLTLSSSITPGGYTYLFCLITSQGASGRLLSGKRAGAPDLTRARNLFQICATVAAAGFAHGPAYSVGWPRPDSSTFLAKLSAVYAEFRDGKPHTAIPCGAPSQVKDDEIDVIAWRHLRGANPPAGYFLGQAASGLNWNDKSLKGTVDQFHGTWFAQPPAATPQVATIIPYVLPTDADARENHQRQEEILGEWRRVGLRHSTVLFRHTVAFLVDEGLEVAQTGVTVERSTDLADVETYVNEFRKDLLAATRST